MCIKHRHKLEVDRARKQKFRQNRKELDHINKPQEGDINVALVITSSPSQVVRTEHDVSPSIGDSRFG